MHVFVKHAIVVYACLSPFAWVSAVRAQTGLPSDKPAERQPKDGGVGRDRLLRYVTDTSLHTKWAIFADSSHPEGPLRMREAGHIAALAQASGNVSAKAPETTEKHTPCSIEHPAVRSGDSVTVWKTQQSAAIRLHGTALRQGCIGERVLVHLHFPEAQLEGYVRAPGSIELVAPALPTMAGQR